MATIALSVLKTTSLAKARGAVKKIAAQFPDRKGLVDVNVGTVDSHYVPVLHYDGRSRLAKKKAVSIKWDIIFETWRR